MHRKCWTIYFTSVCNVNTCLFAGERSGRNRCTCVQPLFNSRAVQQYIVCTSIYVVVEPRAQQSTAKHLRTKRYTIKHVPIRLCTTRITYVMHASSRLFWSMELLTFTRRLFAPKMLDHILCTSVLSYSNPFFLPSERSGRNRPLREAPCTYIYFYHRTLSALPHDCLPTLEPGTRSRISARLMARGDETTRAHQEGAPRARGYSPRPSRDV